MLLVTNNGRASYPDADVISYIQSARELVKTGRLPDRGTRTSFGSYATPGLSWLFVPGVITSSDPRLFSFIGSGFLHLATLVGIFLLAHRYLDLRNALVAVCLYGASGIAIYLASALWPRGQPAFYVWMVLFTCLWVDKRKARYLAAALITIAAGVYVFMEVAPALLALPVVWLVYRPPIDWRVLVLAGVTALVIWFPYLRFEASRHFIDLKSQILLQDVRSSNQQTWCDPNSPALQTESPAAVGSAHKEGSKLVRLGLTIGRRFLGIAGGLVSNFANQVPGSKFVLMIFAVAGCYLLICYPKGGLSDLRFLNVSSITFLAIGLIFVGLIANEVLVERYIGPLTPNGALVPDSISRLRSFQILTAGLGTLLLLRHHLAKVISNLSSSFRPVNSQTLVLGLCLVIPWTFLLLFAEHGRSVRFFWLLPIQVIAIAAALSTFRPLIGLMLGAIFVACCLSETPLLSTIIEGHPNGWSGADDSRIKVAEFLASRIPADRKSVSIGYAGVGDDIRQVTQIYKIGADFDLSLESLYGISNSNDCPEGVAVENDFRIVESPDLVDHRLVDGFHSLGRIDDYEVFERNK
jgi:hypothetical protein